MLIYRTNGRVDRVTLQTRVVSLAELQAAVCGYIELVPGAGRRAFCNEDGHRLGLAFNPLASRRFGQTLIGDVAELEPFELVE